MPLHLPTRRTFLKATAAAGVAAFAAPRVLAREAGGKLNVGLVGCGNRGGTILTEVLKLGHRTVAWCDVADFRYDALDARLGKALGNDWPPKDEPKRYHDYKELFEHKGLDAVIIATPDHHHRDVLLAAMAAKKPAYCEKPLTKSIPEGEELVDAVQKAGVVVQVGNQRHSGPHWERAADVVRKRAFGDLVWAKVWDCRNWLKKDPFAPPADFKYDPTTLDWDKFLGPAPKRPFDAHRYWSWRWYWDYAGGLLTDIGAHQLDIVQWLGGVAEPKSAVANGGVYHFRTRETGRWETPDVVHGVWDYGSFAATFAVEFLNGADGVGAAFYGTKQTLICDADAGGEIRLYDTADKITPSTTPIQTWKVEAETPLHVKNWVDAVTNPGDVKPNSPIELGARVILAAHLANMSYRTGKKIHWDAGNRTVIPG